MIQSFDDPGATTNAPRTAIAFNDTHVLYIVVDGRDPYRSVGMTIDELAIFARDILGAHWGIAQDGGGSSTIVVNGEVKNNTFCNMVFCQSKIFLPYISRPGPEVELTDIIDPLERLVANGMMMVVVDPLERSTTFMPDDQVITLMPTEIRLGPGTNYSSISSIPSNSIGIILDHHNNLEGVFAKGTYWWKVAFGSEVGWVVEDALALNEPLITLLRLLPDE